MKQDEVVRLSGVGAVLARPDGAPHAHSVFDAIKLFRDRNDVREGTKAKILANRALLYVNKSSE